MNLVLSDRCLAWAVLPGTPHPHLSGSCGFIIPSARTGPGGGGDTSGVGPGEPGLDRATCVMQWSGRLAGAPSLCWTHHHAPRR